MIDQNPYQTPAARPAVSMAERTYAPQLFALSGRIGRLRYLAYSAFGPFFAALLGFLGIALIGKLMGKGLVLPMTSLLMLSIFIFSIAITVRRLNDMDMSGWLALLLLVPLANLVIWVLLVFKGGSEGVNRYGPAPSANSILVILGSLLFPILMVVGFVTIASFANMHKTPHGGMDSPFPSMQDTSPSNTY